MRRRQICSLAWTAPLLLFTLTVFAFGAKPGDNECGFGDTYQKMGDLAKAREFYQAAVKANPQHPRAYCRLADTYRDSDPKQAIEHYTQAIHIDPALAMDALFGRGVCYAQLGDSDRAIIDLSEAIRLNPLNAEMYSWRAKAFTRRGDLPRALDDYVKAVQLGTLDPATYAGRGAVYAEKGQLERALADFNEAIRLGPNNGPAYYSRGKFFSKIGRGDLR